MNETTLKILKAEQAKLEREADTLAGHVAADEAKLKTDKDRLADMRKRAADIAEVLNHG